MKKLTGILIAAFALMCGISAYAETAQPSSAIVTVDGNPVDFCAYNLYGSNYFMLRDVAAALKGTDKEFNITWNGHITIEVPQYKNFKGYEPIGTEFSQSADASSEAEFSVPDVRMYVSEPYEYDAITLVGYNINGSNYFKIRDIARIFDFSVEYENGTLAIDTTEQYAPEEPYDGAGIIGMAHEAILALFINEMPIVSYYTAVDAAYNETQLARINENPRLNGVYVDAKNLENYGFDVTVYEDAVWLTRNKDKKFGILNGETINSAPTDISEVYASEMKVYLDGADTRNILINGEPYIAVAELLRYGIFSNSYQGINIDFLRYDLASRVETTDMEDIKLSSGKPYFENVCHPWGTTIYRGGGLVKYSVQEGANNNLLTKYIGEGEVTDTEIIYNGKGIYEYSVGMVAGWAGGAVQTYKKYERGDFVNGECVDGIKYRSEYIQIPGGKQKSYRYEGAMVNGYKREFTNDGNSKYRFNYRAEREGTIENGEYVGYYREYDEDGKLIFEGDYNDWIKQNG